MTESVARPRPDQAISYELLRREGDGEAIVIGTATFRDGRASVDAPEEVLVAISELLARAFVDRIRADDRPRGYRRSGQGQVDMLVPGMSEHFTARLRGLWLPYPDGSVVTARPAAAPVQHASPADTGEGSVSVTDPAVRRASLADSGAVVNAGPLVRANDPASGVRPVASARARTDCGWVS